MTGHRPDPDSMTYITVPAPRRDHLDGRRALWGCKACDRWVTALHLPNRETPVYRHLPR